MIEETARVVAINGSQVTLQSQLKSTCHSCSQQDDCGSGQVAKAFPQKRLTTEITTDIKLAIGDEVVIGVQDKDLLTAAFEVYMLPLIAMLIAASFAQLYLVEQLGWSEVYAIIFAMFAAVIGFLVAKKRQNSSGRQRQLQPTLIRKCDNQIAITEVL